MSTRHIAKLLGVSAATVSLALRGSPKISEATKRRVHQLAKKTGYRPSAKVTELMEQVRASREPRDVGCFGVISLYDHPRPWEHSEHLKRIHASMTMRAFDLGYRLESLWLGAPGMTMTRFQSVLDARGIQGLLCFGSPGLEDHFPTELNHCAIVTVGLSIRTPLHRVTSHIYNDTIHALEKVYQLGYRRPGLVLSPSEDIRGAHTHASAYLGWCDKKFPGANPTPVLVVDKVEEQPLMSWLNRHQPDVIIFAHLHEGLKELGKLLTKHNITVPKQLGVAGVSHFLEGTGFSGMQQNQLLIGAWAVELLLARIVHRDFGLPVNPRIEMVESRWIDGASLARA